MIMDARFIKTCFQNIYQTYDSPKYNQCKNNLISAFYRHLSSPIPYSLWMMHYLSFSVYASFLIKGSRENSRLLFFLATGIYPLLPAAIVISVFSYFTVTAIVTVLLPLVIVILVMPIPRAVILPLLLTVATLFLEDLYVTACWLVMGVTEVFR